MVVSVLVYSQGPWTGVTGAVSLSDLDFVEGLGLRMVELASRIDGLLDWLADLAFDNFARERSCYCSCLSSSIRQRLIAFFLFFETCANRQRNLT